MKTHKTLNGSESGELSTEVLGWLTDILFERFGRRFVVWHDKCVLWLELPDLKGAICFDRILTLQNSSSSLACSWWNAVAENWLPACGDVLPAPGVSSLAYPLIEFCGQDVLIHYDVLGLVYWALSRTEEVGCTDLDEHGRFAARSSHAFRHGYLERPIVDEWMDVLGQVIQRQWPHIDLRRHRFEMKVSHDVDEPSRYGLHGVKRLARQTGGHLLKRGDLRNAAQAAWIWLTTRDQLHPRDPFNTFDWLMDQSDVHGLTSAFYFICGRTNPARDAHYEIEQLPMRALIRRIHLRGHEVGLHPSYNTYRRPEQIAYEAARLRRVCAEEGIDQTGWGGRMHFLRWKQPTTLAAWDFAGMDYDSTLGYADRPGFRCGTCFEYPAFDPVAGRALNLRIRPLVAMECAVMDKRYMGLGAGEAALTTFLELKRACRAVGGTFTLLWHNSRLVHGCEADIYRSILQQC